MVDSRQKIVVASNNSGKINEFRAMLGDNWLVLSMQEVGYCDDIVEWADTFVGNAEIKARAVFEFCNMATIADDSGLCIKALNNAPGVLSARYSLDHDNDANINAVLKDMQNKDDRQAYFECAICYIDIMGSSHIATGRANGDIARERKGTNGFGYDSIFISSDLKMTFAQATQEQKAQVSHRAKAIKELEKILK